MCYQSVLSSASLVTVMLDEVNVEVDRTIEDSHQVRQLSDTIYNRRKLYIKLQQGRISFNLKCFNDL